MKLFKVNKNARKLEQGSVLTIGNFDGVHGGHQALIAALVAKSHRLQLPSVVVIFEPHPKAFLSKSKEPQRISSLREKLYYLKELGIDYIFCIRFNDIIAQTSPQQFIQTILIEQLHLRYILIGHDFHFGKDRMGNQILLQQLAEPLGFHFEVFDSFKKKGQRISSTTVRQLLLEQDIENLSFYLGRHYSIIGKVIPGRKLARRWEMPTANIAISRQRLTLSGVFCVNIRICDHPEVHRGVANLGYRPTIDGCHPILEVHLFDFNADLYGQFLEVAFLSKIRDEQKFLNVDALRNQIKNDIICAKHFFGKTN